MKPLHSCLQFTQKLLKRNLSFYPTLLSNKPPQPPPLDLCCRSGCANCVWINHAEELIKYYKTSGLGLQKALEAIDKEVDDESLKQYLKMEIKFLNKKS